MKVLSRIVSLLLISGLLASCGGGGGGGGGAFNPTPAPSITVTSATTSISQNSFIDLNVVVKHGDGSVAADGTSVSAQLTPATIGTLAGAGGTASGATATNTTTGGRTTFRFSSTNQNGTAHITLSVSGVFVATTSVDIGVNGAGSDPRLQLSSSAMTLPINRSNGFPFIGSPYLTEVDVTWRRANGELIAGTKTVTVSINPVTVAAFSTLDNPETDWDGATKNPPTAEGNEFLTLVGSGPVNVTGGHGTIFVHSGTNSGQATLTVTAIDPDNSQTITATQVFTVSSGTPALPASVNASVANAPVYIQGSGGNTSTPINALVTDGGDQLVPDPLSGNNAYNNVKFEIITQGNIGGAILTAVNAQGQNISGTSVVGRTAHGIASAAFHSGTLQGPIQIRATADRADNNVDNGIQDPVSGTATVVVSDGKLFNLVITSPTTNALQINPVSSGVAPTDQSGAPTIPPNPDGTYSLTISIIATDRQGNPVLPGTGIRFGLIDSPLIGFPSQGGGTFAIAGSDGNPQEANTLFTAPTGHFQTAGGGAGPGDTLLVFGKGVTGNRDLESARVVQHVNTETSLNVVTRFNYNDDTGVTVDSGPVLPYVIGRATDGNITAAATTNELGVARTTMNYPVSRLGKTAAIWAEGNGDTVNGSVEVVTDARLLRFPGVATAHVVASPNPIRGNSTTSITVCVTDYLNSPIQGVSVDFAFQSLGNGRGSLDSQPTSGTLTRPTGTDGCTVGSVTTVGIEKAASGSGSSGGPTLRLTAAGATADVGIVAGGGLVLQASPSAFYGSGGPVTLTLLDDSGNPVPGVQLSGSCTSTNEAAVGLITPPGITDAKGQTTTTIGAGALNQYGKAGGGVCTFTTPSGSPTTTVVLQGVDLCIGAAGFSPPLPQCSTVTQTPATLTVILRPQGAAAVTGNVVSAPAGAQCSINGAANVTCTGQFNTGTRIQLTATPAPGFTFVSWSGNCVAADVATPNVAQITLSQSLSCTAIFGP